MYKHCTLIRSVGMGFVRRAGNRAVGRDLVMILQLRRPGIFAQLILQCLPEVYERPEALLRAVGALGHRRHQGTDGLTGLAAGPKLAQPLEGFGRLEHAAMIPPGRGGFPTMKRPP